jgi:hypothetical protein
MLLADCNTGYREKRANGINATLPLNIHTGNQQSNIAWPLPNDERMGRPAAS